MIETTSEPTTSPISQLFGNMLGAILVGTIDDKIQK